MFKPISTPGLELEEDIPFQNRFRRAQLTVWVLATIVIVAALAGLFGSGFLSTATAGGVEDGLEFRYNRFARHQSPTDLQVALTIADPNATQAEFWIVRSLVEQYQLESVSPEPESVETEGERLVYTFAVAPGTEVLEVVLRVQPDEFGFIPLQLGTGDTELIDVTQLVYP